MEATVFLAQWTRRRDPSKDYAAKRTLHLILVWQHSYAEPYKHLLRVVQAHIANLLATSFVQADTGRSFFDRCIQLEVKHSVLMVHCEVRVDYAAKRTLHLILVRQHSYAEPRVGLDKTCFEKAVSYVLEQMYLLRVVQAHS